MTEFDLKLHRVTTLYDFAVSQTIVKPKCDCNGETCLGLVCEKCQKQFELDHEGGEYES